MSATHLPVAQSLKHKPFKTFPLTQVDHTHNLMAVQKNNQPRVPDVLGTPLGKSKNFEFPFKKKVRENLPMVNLF